MDKFLSGSKRRVEYHQQEKGKKDYGRRHFPLISQRWYQWNRVGRNIKARA